MESILARALEYTLKYWLKSFTRDQFKLQGRTVQLSNLDINGDALHASMGLPAALNVTTARVGKFEIILPSVSNVQIEPIVVQIDKLDLVLEENDDINAYKNSSSAPSPTSAGKGSGYGFADKIADGMTVEVRTVNLLLETHGGARQRGGASWASPMASITIRNLLLYTTNENWEVVNLKEARDFSSDKKFIYVFKKLEWEHLSIDLLPHPDMFLDENFVNSEDGSNKKDADGAKRVFFGGERFVEGISGEAYITIQRTDLNSPLGLEVQLHVIEAVCPALSEPGLRALLRFFTGLYVCLNRGDVNPNIQQSSSQAAGRSLVSLIVDHIFLCIKDTEFQLELLVQSLFFSRGSVSDGENAKHLTRIMISGLFLRDTFARPPCAIIQPSMQTVSVDVCHIPDFGENFCPPIYPLGDHRWQLNLGMPLICLHSLQLVPSPIPPIFATRTSINCQPLIIHLQEESCLRIASFLADGIVVHPGTILPDSSIESLVFNLRGLDVTVPVEIGKTEYASRTSNTPFENSFVGARLHIQDLMLSKSPILKLRLLNLEKDPACFCLWKGQPVDASQRKVIAGASLISLSLETCKYPTGMESSHTEASGLWRCLELKDVCFEIAMVTADGSPLTNIPPPGGIVRIGIDCQQYLSNTSVEQLFFVLDLYAHFGRVFERIAIVGKKKTSKTNKDMLDESMMDNVPGDTAVTLAVKDLQLRFLESSSDIQGNPLLCFMGGDLFIKVCHRTFGGARAISSTLRWERVEVECTDTVNDLGRENDHYIISDYGQLGENDLCELRTVFWVQKSALPFLDINTVHVIPYSAQDIECHSLNVSACIAGVRLGGGMNYAESLLHRFGILGPDGGPGEGLVRGLDKLSDGPLSKLFKASPLVMDGPVKNSRSEDGNSNVLHVGAPDDVDITIELKDWLFALEGSHELAASSHTHNAENSYREERSWHTTFRSVHANAKSSEKHVETEDGNLRRRNKFPIELITVGMEGLQILKPMASQGILSNGKSEKGIHQNGLPDKDQISTKKHGVNIEADLVVSEDDTDDAAPKFAVENLKFSVREPVEAVVSRDELEHLIHLCKSEIDSMGRIAAGVLRILKIEGSIGSAAINQLSNIGSGSFDKIFNPEKLSNGASSLGLGPSPNRIQGSRSSGLELTVASLEATVADSQSKCAALFTELNWSEASAQYLEDVKQLNEKLESVQKLLDQLRTQL